MDTLKSLQVFRTIVEKGSFTKAADALDMSLAMTSKHWRINRITGSLKPMCKPSCYIATTVI